MSAQAQCPATDDTDLDVDAQIARLEEAQCYGEEFFVGLRCSISSKSLHTKKTSQIQQSNETDTTRHGDMHQASARLPAELMTLASAWASRICHALKAKRTWKSFILSQVAGASVSAYAEMEAASVSCLRTLTLKRTTGDLEDIKDILTPKRQEILRFTSCLSLHFRLNVGRTHRKHHEHTQVDMKLRLRLTSCQQFGRLRKASSQTMCWET